MSEVRATALATFAKQLRAHRKARGWSQVVLGDKLGYSDSLISGIENCDKSPTAEFSAACDEQFGTPETFADLHALITREALPSYFAPVVGFESEAVRIHEWELGSIPGLLQTEAYARSVISAGRPRLTDAELERDVQNRMERQKIFGRDNPPMLWVVLHESVLRHVIGSRAIMAEQVDRLTAAAATPDLVLQVLPYAAHEHPGTDGPIMIYDFPDGTSKGYAECNRGGMVSENASDVGELMTTLNLIRAASLAPRDSADLLRQIRSELDGERHVA